jgi:hypothetical protein
MSVRLFSQLAQPVHVPALRRIEKQFQTEFDYRKEAENPIVSETIIKAGLAGPGKLSNSQTITWSSAPNEFWLWEELHGGKQSHSRRILRKYAAREGQSMNDFVAQKEKSASSRNG